VNFDNLNLKQIKPGKKNDLKSKIISKLFKFKKTRRFEIIKS